MITDNDFKNLLSQTKEYNIEKILQYIEINNGLTKDQNDILFDEYYKYKGIMEKDKIIARTILIKGNEHLIYFILKKYCKCEEELFSVGKIGLIKAVDSYDKTRCKFSSYAAMVIRNDVYMYLRKSRSLSRGGKDNCEYSLDYIDEDTGLNFYDTISEESNFVEEVENEDLFEYVKKFFKHLTPEEQIAVRFYVGLYDGPPLNYNEIAPIIKRGSCMARKIVLHGLEKLRILTNKDENEDKYNRLSSFVYKLVTEEDINACKEGSMRI